MAAEQAWAAMNFWVILRIAAILLGIASATLMAVDGFKIPVDQAFLEILEGVREFVGVLVWPLDKLLVTPLVGWLRDQGFAVSLWDHWKTHVVILWLLMGAIARTTNGGGWQVFLWCWGGVCATIGGVLAGTVPLSSTATGGWAMCALFAYATVALVVTSEELSRSRNEPTTWTDDLGAALYLLGLLLSGFFLSGLLVLSAVYGRGTPRGTGTFSFLANSAAPGLAFLVFLVCSVGVFSLLASVPRGSRRAALRKVGFDILSVMGGATAIVYIANRLA